MNDRDRCDQVYQDAIRNRPFGQTVAQGNYAIAQAKVARRECIASIAAGTVCNGHTRPTNGPRILQNAGITYRTDGYKCTPQGWTYNLTLTEAKALQAYENKQLETPLTPAKRGDYTMAVYNGKACHVWTDGGGDYIVEYGHNQKIYLRSSWWKTHDGRQHAETQVTSIETHVTPNPIPPDETEPIPPDDETEESFLSKLNPCRYICKELSGDKPLKECGTFDVGCKLGNISQGAQTTILGKTCYIACIVGLGLLAAVLILFALFGRGGATKVILSGAETSKEAVKTTGKAVSKLP